MIRGGAKGLSVLTQPHLFGGSPEYFAKVRQSVDVPMLMKDIVIHKKQIDAAACIGADYILLIQAVFDMFFDNETLDEYMTHAHQKGLGILLEVHTAREYKRAQSTKADIVGINNRNLDTLAIDTDTTRSILSRHRDKGGRIVISESGIASPEDIRSMRSCGADGFLVGSSIMKSRDVEKATREMVNAY